MVLKIFIREGEFFKNPFFLEAIEKAKERNSKVHLMCLIQEEGVHGATRHVNALLKLCKQQNFSDVLIHAITDGRDTAPRSAKVDHSLPISQGPHSA
ncbi:MAG: hypothetical protein DSY82_05215 [Flavobacteriia bacterium]|nr:MAG: hypothetical protein DSY82_05215 [Flavobacteriia bacterium]